MTEALSSILSVVKPRPQLANPQEDPPSRFLLDEAKFLAKIMEEPSPGGSLKVAAR
jgi:hypothetical protein